MLNYYFKKSNRQLSEGVIGCYIFMWCFCTLVFKNLTQSRHTYGTLSESFQERSSLVP